MGARWLRQSTSVDLPIGPFVDSVDGFTPKTALSITQPDIRLKKGQGNWTQKNAAQTLTHEENGFYEVTYDVTDTNTFGHLKVAVFKSGALPVWDDYFVVPANVWDSYASTDLLQVDLTEIIGDAGASARMVQSYNSESLVTIGAGSTTTNIVTSSISPTAAVTNQFIGRVLLFSRLTTTVNLRGQGTKITASTSGGVFTVDVLTTAPVSGDIAVIA
jgi:hypothetical protein